MKLPDPNALPHYRADIDGLRALAIIAVVAFHAFPLLVPGGFVGVDVFFVISGYLISGIILANLAKGRFSFADFYLRRIKRLFPALVAVLVPCYIAGWFLLLPEDFKQLGKHIAGGSVFVSNFVLWRESGYFDQFVEFKPLLHLWSLGIEEQFYLAWPLSLYLAWKWRLNFLYVTLGIAAISFALNITLVNDHHSAAFYCPVTRLWELLMGAALACLTLEGQHFSGTHRGTAHTVMAGVAVLLLLLAIFGITDGVGFPGWWALLPTIGAFLLIALGPGTWVHRRFLSHPLMVGIGAISYPLYLWHWPLLSYLRIIYPDSPPASYLLATVLLSILLAWLTYRFLERPVRFGKTGMAKIIWLVVALETIGAIGFITYTEDGFAFRIPQSIRAFVTAIGYPYEDWRAGTCYLDPAKEKFDDVSACIEKGEKPLVLLWGDSHGASLYPGLKALEETHDFRLAQFTTSSCPPLLTWDKPEYTFCKYNNDTVFALIGKIHPAIVLLQGRWDFHDNEIAQLELTLRKLKKIDKARIILVGPTPRWKFSLSTLARTQLISQRMPGLCLESIPAQNNTMRAIAQKYGVEFISPYEALCNEEGCLMHGTGENAQALVFDSDHLSPQGSRVLMQLLAKEMFPDGVGEIKAP